MNDSRKSEASGSRTPSNSEPPSAAPGLSLFVKVLLIGLGVSAATFVLVIGAAVLMRG